MNAFAELVARQICSDLAALPGRLRRQPRRTPRWQRAVNVEELRAAARRAVPRAIFDFADGGACDEVTLRRNLRDFERVALAPHVLADVSRLDPTTTVLGERVALPLLGSPTGLSGLVHPRGEVALARAVHAAGSVYVLSAMASHSIEEVARDAPGPTWFQLYAWRDRGLVEEVVARAHLAGYRALVLTVDVPCSGRRERDLRNGFSIPPRLTLRSCMEGLLRPRWSAAFMRDPRVVAASLEGRASVPGDAVRFSEYINGQFDPALQWRDLAWLRERWPGPLVVKGVLRAEDARTAVGLGADAVIVSNHGGRQLDHVPSALAALPAVVDAVGDDAELYLDGGVRRGADVLKALALGARACMTGRPLLYGLAAGGEAGAAHAMRLLADELRMAMALAGCPTVTAVDRSWVTSAEQQ